MIHPSHDMLLLTLRIDGKPSQGLLVRLGLAYSVSDHHEWGDLVPDGGEGVRVVYSDPDSGVVSVHYLQSLHHRHGLLPVLISLKHRTDSEDPLKLYSHELLWGAYSCLRTCFGGMMG